MAKKNKRPEKIIKTNYLIYLFEIAPFILGLSNVYTKLFFGAVIFISLLILILTSNKIEISFSKNTIAGLVIFVFSFITIFTGINREKSFTGFLILLSYAAFVFLLMKLQKDYGSHEDFIESMLHTLPETAAILVIVSAICSTIDFINKIVLINHRLSGFFQYANTMGLYLLIALIFYFYREKDNNKGFSKIYDDYILPIIIVVGIIWTGSRFTFVLFAATIIFIFIKKKEERKKLLVISIVIIAALICYAAVSGNMKSFARIFTFSKNSTLMGRFLYWVDALPIIIRHPLGLGYLGYNQIEPLIQHGVYDVKFIHNEILQCFLDYGWLSGAAFIFLFVNGIVKSKGRERLVLVILFIHCLFDFDFQFFIIAWIFLALMPFHENIKTISVNKGGRVGVSLVTLFSLIFLLQFGISNCLDYFGRPDLAINLDRCNEFSLEKVMIVSFQNKEYDDAKIYAERVIAQNENNVEARNVLSSLAEMNQDYDDMIPHKEIAVKTDRYNMEEYDDYIGKLSKAIEFYKENNDEEKSKDTISKLKEIPDFIKETKNSTNPLSYKTVDAPDFSLSDESNEIIRSFE